MDPVDPADPRMNSGRAGESADEFQIAHFIYVFTANIAGTSLRRDVFFFNFFISLSSKTPSFESFFGRWPARNALKTRYFS